MERPTQKYKTVKAVSNFDDDQILKFSEVIRVVEFDRKK